MIVVIMTAATSIFSAQGVGIMSWKHKIFVGFNSQTSGLDLHKFVSGVYIKICWEIWTWFSAVKLPILQKQKRDFYKQSLAHRGTWQNEFSKPLLLETFCYMAPD